MEKITYTNVVTNETKELNVNPRVSYTTCAAVAKQIANAVLENGYAPFVYDVALGKGILSVFTDMEDIADGDELMNLFDDTDILDRLKEVVDTRQLVRINDWAEKIVEQELKERSEVATLMKAVLLAMNIANNPEALPSEAAPAVEEVKE